MGFKGVRIVKACFHDDTPNMIKNKPTMIKNKPNMITNKANMIKNNQT